MEKSWTIQWTKGRQRGVRSQYVADSAFQALALWEREDMMVGAFHSAVEAVYPTPESWGIAVRHAAFVHTNGPMTEAKAETWMRDGLALGGSSNDFAMVPWMF